MIAVDLLGQGLDAAAGALRAIERLGQRGEARDIGEQGRAGCLLGEVDTGRQGMPAVLWQVGSKRGIHHHLLNHISVLASRRQLNRTRIKADTAADANRQQFGPAHRQLACLGS